MTLILKIFAHYIALVYLLVSTEGLPIPANSKFGAAGLRPPQSQADKTKPSYFWGAATAAFQFEGAWNEDGKGPSVWDHWTHIPGHTLNNQTADVATDFYHRYKDDIQIMKALGQKAFRFSISWPRILPNGTGEVNQAGIDHYNNVIDALLEADIEPLVTVFHWDLPWALFEDYKGWLSDEIVADFANFAIICFESFGDRVKYWSTFNEMVSYVNGFGSPDQFHAENTINNVDQWTVVYNILNAHALAVEAFREIVPNGMITSNFALEWVIPLTNSSADAAQVQPWLDNQLGAFADPMYFGDWPQSVKERFSDILPQFTAEQSQRLKGSFDYFALNYYKTRWVYANESVQAGFNVTNLTEDNKPAGGELIEGAIITPNGLKEILLYVADRYGNPEIMITENGCADPQFNYTSLAQDAIQDNISTYYYQVHLDAINQAIAQGVRLKGYIQWAFTDNYEWRGFNPRMGTIYTDYYDQQRTVKASGWWLSKYFASGQNMTTDESVAYALSHQYDHTAQSLNSLQVD